MVIRRLLVRVSAGLLAISLFSCSTVHRKIPEQALIKLPEKKVIEFKNISVKTLGRIKASTNSQLQTELKLIVPSVEPVWIPPVIVRVLILPFVDRDNVLHGGQYVFAELKKGGWLFGNYLYRKPGFVIDPLSHPEPGRTVGNIPFNTVKQQSGPPAVKQNSFFTGGNPHLPSGSNQFSLPGNRKGPPEAYEKQFDSAVNSIKH